MIEVISPSKIEKNQSLIGELVKFGLDYFDPKSVIGWNYILDHVWLIENMEDFLENSNIDNPVVFDVGCGNSPFHNFAEKSLGIDIVGIDRPEGYCHQENLSNTDYSVDFLEFNEFPKESIDMIYWLSSIEHNEELVIKKLYRKSISLLKPGGLLLITFPLSRKTCWFEESQQTNLSVRDAKLIYNESEILGDYDVVIKEFRENALLLKDRYKKRYGRFGPNDPQFIVGGLSQKKRNKKS